MSEKKYFEKPTTIESNMTESNRKKTEGVKLASARLDLLLVQLGYAQSRERAKALIKSGYVSINGKPITKTATHCASNEKIEVSEKDIPWVSRAALKLEKALDTWPIDVTDSVCLDIGSSTGGFTEVLLHHKAKKVYALDVGHDQLAQKLRDDSRVVVMEGKNIRVASDQWFREQIDFITTDVSFISLRLVLPKVAELLREGGEAVLLIKPQFEIGRQGIKKGVVRDPILHLQVIENIKALSLKNGLTPIAIIDSPIEGIEGNKEFLIHLKKLSNKP